MEKTELISIIAGAILSLLFAIIKRWVVLDKKAMGRIVLIVSFLVASVIELFEDSWNWDTYLSKVGEVYASSQIVYWVLLKEFGLEERIEGK